MDFREVRNDFDELKIYREDAEVLNWDKPKFSESPEKIIFVDGRQRHLLNYEGFPSKKILISQIVVGAIAYCCNELKLIEEPASYFIVARTPSVGELKISLKGEYPIVEVVDSGELSQVSSRIMAEKELELSRSLAEKGLGVVIKDGSLKPIFQLRIEPTFVRGSGPLGLVKSVQSVLDPDLEERILSDVEIGRRSKAFVARYSENDRRIDIVSSYIRIGKSSFVRLDAVFSRSVDMKDILELFDSLAKALSDMTIDVQYGRYPNDIPPVQGLEQILGAYLYDPLTVESLIHVEGGVL